MQPSPTSEQESGRWRDSHLLRAQLKRKKKHLGHAETQDRQTNAGAPHVSQQPPGLDLESARG